MKTCSVCGGPIRSHNKVGICERNPECRKAHDKARDAAYVDRHRELMRERARAMPRETIQAMNLRSAHGITLADKQAMLDAQGGRCYLCGNALTLDDAVIDHDHRCCSNKSATGKRRVKSCEQCRRGLACDPCNTIIGLADESPEKLMRIAESLSRIQPSVNERIAGGIAAKQLI